MAGQAAGSAEGSASSMERTTDVTAGPGGVMTDEVGIVTGDLTLRTEVDDAGRVTQRVQYKDADEWYAVTGAPTALAEGQDIDAVHAATLSRVAAGAARDE
jgi:hypothetical protein